MAAAAATSVALSASPLAAQTETQEHGVCTLDVDLRQSRFSLNPFSHMKDSMNAVQFKLPTACENLSNFSEGDDLVDNFRAGSLFIDGSLGSWRLSVDEEPQMPANVDDRSCTVELELKQSRFSLNPMQHLKDAANAVRFEWDIPGDVYDATSVGDDYVSDGFRAGSLIFRQSVGKWNLEVQNKLGCSPS